MTTRKRRRLRIGDGRHTEMQVVLSRKVHGRLERWDGRHFKKSNQS